MLAHPARYLFCSTLLTVLCQAADIPAASQVGDGVKFTEVFRKEFNLGDHTFTVIRVRKPDLPLLPASPTPPPLTAEQQAISERRAQKSCAMLNVSATVYIGPRPITEIRWRNDTGTREYRAWSNADFRYLTQLTDLETESTVYQWFPFVDAYPLADWPSDQKSPLPQGLNLSATDAEYVVEASAKELADQETTLTGLDYLHAYYQLHQAELKAACEKMAADNAAREKELREHPPVKPDTVIRFWPIQSKTNPR